MTSKQAEDIKDGECKHGNALASCPLCEIDQKVSINAHLKELGIGGDFGALQDYRKSIKEDEYEKAALAAETHYQSFLKNTPAFYNNRTQYMKDDFMAGYERGRREAIAEVMPTIEFYATCIPAEFSEGVYEVHFGDDGMLCGYDKFGKRARALKKRLTLQNLTEVVLTKEQCESLKKALGTSKQQEKEKK